MFGDHECPICCSQELKGAELDWYPCPCGFQLCSFCFERISKDSGRCPYCRRIYDSDAIDRVGEKYRPVPVKEHAPEPIPTPSIFVLSRTMVEIIGIPVSIASAGILTRKEYLGQYGRIQKIACYSADKNPFLKISARIKARPAKGEISQQTGGYVYVQFMTEDEAKTCIYALNDSFFKNSRITACPAITEQCASFLQGKECKSSNCMKLHQQVDPQKCLAFSADEIDNRCERFLSASKVLRPPMYECYPKRAFGVAKFPPPRLIPPQNGNKNFIITSTVGNYREKVSLLNLATEGDYILMPCLPARDTRLAYTSLVNILGLDNVDQTLK